MIKYVTPEEYNKELIEEFQDLDVTRMRTFMGKHNLPIPESPTMFWAYIYRVIVAKTEFRKALRLKAKRWLKGHELESWYDGGFVMNDAEKTESIIESMLSEVSLHVFEFMDSDVSGCHSLKFMASFDSLEDARIAIHLWLEEDTGASFTILPVFDTLKVVV